MQDRAALNSIGGNFDALNESSQGGYRSGCKVICGKENFSIMMDSVYSYGGEEDNYMMVFTGLKVGGKVKVGLLDGGEIRDAFD